MQVDECACLPACLAACLAAECCVSTGVGECACLAACLPGCRMLCVPNT